MTVAMQRSLFAGMTVAVYALRDLTKTEQLLTPWLTESLIREHDYGDGCGHFDASRGLQMMDIIGV